MRWLSAAREEDSSCKLVATATVFTISFSILSIAFAKLAMTALTASMNAAAFILM